MFDKTKAKSNNHKLRAYTFNLPVDTTRKKYFEKYIKIIFFYAYISRYCLIQRGFNEENVGIIYSLALQNKFYRINYNSKLNEGKMKKILNFSSILLSYSLFF